MTVHVNLFEADFEPFTLIKTHQKINPTTGAQAIFIGYMRDFRESNSVCRMSVTQYPPMTENYLTALAQKTYTTYRLLDLYVAHRVGDVQPTMPLVVIAATASHRTNAIQATETLLEQLKHHVPLWKKEYDTDDNGQWVDKNSDNRRQ